MWNPSNRGRGILLAGPSGVGKTTLVSQFTPGNTYWIIDPKETGIIDLMDSRMISIHPSMISKPISDFNNLLYFNNQIIARQSPIPQNAITIVYESISGFEAQCHKYTCDVEYKGNWGEKGFMNYQKGYEISAVNYWSQFMDQILKLRDMGYNVVITGHTYVGKEKNASGVDYLVESVRCRKETWGVMQYVFENIFYLSYDVESERGDNKDKIAGGVGKAKSFTKMLYVNKTPHRDAKNRCGLVQDLEAEGTPQQIYATLCQAARWNPMTLRYV